MGWWSRLSKTVRGQQHESEIDEELKFHLDMDIADGHDTRDARLRLGNLTGIREETRANGILRWLDSALQDARYALRQLRTAPALVLAVVLSIGIGVGANTAIFSLVDAALLRPLPVAYPDSLRIIEWTSSGFPEGIHNINGDFSRKPDGRFQGSSVSAHLYRRLAREQMSFDALIGIADGNSVAVATDAAPAEQLSLQYVGSNFFQALGRPPVIGRPFLAEEDRVGAEPAVILSHRFWTHRLGGTNDAINRRIRVNNVPARIVGIAPPGFFGLRSGQWTDIYAPLAMRVAFSPVPDKDQPRGENDRDWWVRQIARVKPGVPEQIALEQFGSLFRNVNAAEGMRPDQIPQPISLPGRRGFNALNARDSNALWILMLLVGVLLFIVCANVANLLLSRSVSRQRESAVRLALGAARSRLFRQHLTESGVLATLGGSAGLVAGYLIAHALHALFQSGRDASSAFDLDPDWRVFGYTAASSILTALLFGLAPALRAARAGLNDALKAQTRSLTGGRLRLPRLLVSIQIALCLVALVAAGLLGRSLKKLQWTDVGFERENLAYASVNPWQAGYSAERVPAYASKVRDELAQIPGVVSVSIAEVRLLSGNGNVARANVPGRSARVERGVVRETEAVSLNRVGEDFFETLRIPVLAGRGIERRDIRPDADAVVVDEFFVRRFFPGESAIGRRFGLKVENDRQYQIVGVVRETRYNSLRNNPVPAVYQPYYAGALRGPIHFAIRAAMPSETLSESIRKVIASVDAAVPVTEFHTQTGLIDRLLRTERMLGFVSAAFGLIALTVAAIGIAGVLAYAVARRKAEIGVRVALGAARNDIARLVLRDCVHMLAVGVLIGLPGAWAIGQFLRTALFQMKPVDPGTAALSFVILLAISLFAAWIPARRAAAIDPMTALREE